MEIKQLRVLVEVYKSNNITKAASSLYMSQQAVSKTIKELERELENNLFVRTTKGVVPTSFCEDLYPICVKMLALEKECIDCVQRHKQSHKTVIEFGFIRGLLNENETITMSGLLNFAQENGFEINLQELITDECFKLMSEKKCDFGLEIYVDEPDHNLYDSILVKTMPIVFCLNKNHIMFEKDEITIDDFKNEQFPVVKEHEFAAYNIKQIFKKANIHTPIKIVEHQMLSSGIKQLFRTKGYVLCAWREFAEEIIYDDMAIYEYDNEDIRYKQYLIWNKGKELSLEEKKLIEYIKKHI